MLLSRFSGWACWRCDWGRKLEDFGGRFWVGDFSAFFSWRVVRFFLFCLESCIRFACFILHVLFWRLKFHFLKLKLSETKELEYTWNWPSSCTSLLIFSRFNDICEQTQLIVWVIQEKTCRSAKKRLEVKYQGLGSCLMKFWTDWVYRAKIPLLSGHDFSGGHRRWCESRLEPHDIN